MQSASTVMLDDVGRLCAACAILGCVYLSVAIAIVLAWKAQEKNDDEQHPEPVTLLKPLHGREPALEACLASFCNQRYGAPIQIVLGVDSPKDSALPAAERLMARFPTQPMAITIDSSSYGSNAKISNLVNMMEEAEHGIIVAADSDMLVGETYIRDVVSLLQEPDVGAVTALYYGVGSRNSWSRLIARNINSHFLPSVLVGLTFGIADPCFGSTIALRRSMLERIGGFKAFANHLADDYEIGAAVRAAGREVKITPFAIAHVCEESSLRELLAHQLRWARTVRTIDLPGYLGSFVGHPFPIAIFGAVAGNQTCLGLAATALALRLALGKAVERKFGFAAKDARLAPAADLISFGVFIWSFFGTRVSWKGISYSVLSDGHLGESPKG